MKSKRFPKAHTEIAVSEVATHTEMRIKQESSFHTFRQLDPVPGRSSWNKLVSGLWCSRNFQDCPVVWALIYTNKEHTVLTLSLGDLLRKKYYFNTRLLECFHSSPYWDLNKMRSCIHTHRNCVLLKELVTAKAFINGCTKQSLCKYLEPDSNHRRTTDGHRSLHDQIRKADFINE